MNRIEILEMETGQELDLAICKEIFASTLGSLKHYSRDILPAWQVVDKMLENDQSLELIIGADGNTLATFFNIGEPVYRHNPNQVVCESVPEAVCKAALLAIIQA